MHGMYRAWRKLFAASITKDWEKYIQELNEMGKSKQSKADSYKRMTEFLRSHSAMEKLSE